MRPIKLELENFGAYSGRHEVDFSPLDFFVIKGKIGSGKSTLIDAICYALYGMAPRYEEKSVSEYLISKGKRSMKVAFEFSIRGKIYRVEREYSLGDGRSSKKRSEFRFYEGGKPKSLKKDENEKYIKEILRLDYKTFTKVLLLPQNQFDRFLKPKESKERREILNSLLQYFDLILTLKDFIGKKVKDLESELRVVETRLLQLQRVNLETINQIEGQIEQLKKEYENLSKEKLEKEEMLRRCRERDRVLLEIKSVEGQLLSLLSRQEAIEQDRKRLETAQELLPYLPKIEEYYRYVKQEEEYTREKRQKEVELAKYSDERIQVEREYQKVKKEFDRLEEYNSEIININGILKLLEDYSSLLADKEAFSQQLRKVEEEISQHTEKEKDCMQRLEKGSALLEEVRRNIKAYEDSGLEDKVKNVEKLKEAIKKLEQIGSEVELLKKEINELQERLEKTRAILEGKTQEYEELTKSLEEEERLLEDLRAYVSTEGELLLKRQRLKELLSKALELESIRKEREKYQKERDSILNQLKNLESELELLETRRLEIYAVELRTNLKEGDVCPVCGGLIKGGYHVEEREDIQSLLSNLRQLQERIKSLRDELNRIETRIGIYSSKERECEEYLSGLSVEDIQRELSNLESQLKELENSKNLLKEKETNIKKLKQIREELLKTIQRIKTEETERREKLLSKENLLRIRKEEENSILKELGREPEEVLKEIKNIEESYQNLRSLREKERKYADRIEALREELYQSQQRITELKERWNNITQRVDELSSKAKELNLQIQTKTGESASKDLELKLKRKKEELSENTKTIQERYQKVSEYLQKITKEEVRLRSEIQSIEKNISDIQKLISAIAFDLHQLDTRFGSLEEAKKHALSREEIAELQSKIETYEKEKHSLEKRLDELKDRLKSFENLPTTEEAEEGLKVLENSIHQNRENYGNLQNELDSKRKELVERGELERKRSELKAEFSIYESLNKDFRDNRFPDYISQIMLHKIVDRGNEYLFRFTSGQYAFELMDGDLCVYDNITGHTRPVSSLSGGETFLASLSLAFAVADIMSQNAPLESLFIDEGFGSLDADTRDSLSDFLFEHIRSSSNRMIGIITHIDDIANKFSQRIEVEKRGGSAHIKVIY
ncbi:MAG: hypothetical protein N3C57_07285 [Aquificaceae bacterium]|nr:hypothetical protein [Aquificaceae bacterium]